MKSLLLALGLALVCQIRAIVIPQTMANVDIQKMEGIWHPVATAVSDSSAQNIFLGIYVKALKLTSKGNLEIVLNILEKGQCTEKTITAEKTAKQAEFIINYLGQYKAFLLDTHQDNEALLCVENTIAPQPNLACQYLVRTLEAQDKAVAQFHAALQMLPVPMKAFQDFPRAEELCHV